MLKPLFWDKPSTGEKVRARLEIVFALGHKYLDGENPAQWRKALELALTKSSVKNASHATME